MTDFSYGVPFNFLGWPLDAIFSVLSSIWFTELECVPVGFAILCILQYFVLRFALELRNFFMLVGFFVLIFNSSVFVNGEVSFDSDD